MSEPFTCDCCGFDYDEVDLTDDHSIPGYGLVCEDCARDYEDEQDQMFGDQEEDA